MTKPDPQHWDIEYHRQGIPSSSRQEPSGVLLWLITNWPYLVNYRIPGSALDIGCGSGRNSLYLASLGVSVVAFDSSGAALQIAQQRLAGNPVDPRPTFLLNDLNSGIPSGAESFDLALDIFVYKHQVDPGDRAAYRKEIARVLKPDGRLLLSLAELGDGFYGACPPFPVDYPGNPKTVVDPVAGVGSVLFDLEALVLEMSDSFRLEMAWRKEKSNLMHGASYERVTLATIWCLKGV